jgi:hypothetical protein
MSYNGPFLQPSLSTLKVNWLGCLKGAVGASCVNSLPCSSSWIKWFSLRGVGVSSIRILDVYAPQISNETFDGACLSSLEVLDLSECSDISDAAITAVVTTSPQLSTIKLANCEITSKALISISENCSKLKTIVLSECSMITSKAIQKLVRGCPLLESIDISGCSCASEKTVKSIARYLPGLLHITFSKLISFNESISDDSIILLAYRCPLLQTIIIDDSQQISDDSLVALGQRCPQLRTISVSCTGVTDLGISALVEGCTLLESITLSDIDEITNESVMAIAKNCPQLLYINLHWLQLLDDSGINALAHGCPLLQSLLLSRCHGVGNGDRFGEYVGMMPNLKNIMFECSEIGDDQMTCLVNGTARLQTIDICDCFQITSQFMIAIAAHCPTLTQLKTSNTRTMITDAGLIALAEDCRLLEEISLSEDTASIGNVVFDSIGQHCSRLRKIDMNMGFTITDVGFLSLLRGCPRLEYISLIVAPDTCGTKGVVSVEDVPRPCRACTRLIEIILHNCDELTDLTLFNIRDSCNALVNLDICDCVGMSESCIEEVAAALPHLSE